MNQKKKGIIAGICVVAVAVVGLSIWVVTESRNTQDVLEATPTSSASSPRESVPPQQGESAAETPAASPSEQQNPDSGTESGETDDGFTYVDDTELSFEQCYEIAQKVAKEQFGDDAFVVSAMEGNRAVEVEIDGKKIACFEFGADSMSNLGQGGSLRGLYHVDAQTGDVYDNGSGTMVKVG